MTRVLVIDDEEHIRTIVKAYLEAEGLTVLCAADGAAGLAMFRQHQPEFVVLDIMLPKIDGLEVLQQIRHESDAYVLMLTAKSEEVDRIVGLTVGADDYITKPFSPRELVARIKVIMRRARSPLGTQDNDVLRFANITIDSNRREVICAGKTIDLTTLEFDLLKTLALHAHHVLSREQLLEQVWGYDYYGENRVVDVHIGHIRQKIEDDPNNPRFLTTIRGIGYKFEDDAR